LAGESLTVFGWGGGEAGMDCGASINATRPTPSEVKRICMKIAKE
jgi:hypothetical protein